MARRPRQPGDLAATYAGHGIGEWYGAVMRNLSFEEREERLRNPPLSQVGEAPKPRWPCPFTTSFPQAAPRRVGGANLDCTKVGGVCSIRGFYTLPGNEGTEEPAAFRNLTCTCPMRFVEDGIAFRHIAAEVLETDDYAYVKEVNFLQRVQRGPDQKFPQDIFGPGRDAMPRAPEQAEAGVGVGWRREVEQPAIPGDTEDVGRIDTLLVDSQNRANWCAVELQAVYFSGGAMSHDFNAIQDQPAPPLGGNAPAPLPLPAPNRRPDFRSSGPKRLLPQLQVKVPSLRRWGKKMVVVVDAPFFNSLGPMEEVQHISNADIVWCVVDYSETEEGRTARLRVAGMVNTTLESAIVGLTAGKPVSKPTFERRMAMKLDRPAAPGRLRHGMVEPPDLI